MKSTTTLLMTLNYLEVPLNFIYNTGAAEGFFIEAGPAMAYGLSGKERFSDGTNSESEKIEFGSGDKQVKRFEFSANVLSGYHFAKGFMFSANYNLRLTSPANADRKDGTFKNNYFAVKIGYILKWK